MTDLANLDSLSRAILGISDQMSTAINVSDIRQRLAPRQNMLINWYFKNPVNQREVSGTIKTVGYFIDRWKLISGTVTITDDGLLLDGVIQQILEFPVDSPTVASVLTTDGLLDDGVEYDNDSRIFQIEAYGSTLVAAKLEAGYRQTLAIHGYSDDWFLNDHQLYQQELAKCQRYLLRFTRERVLFGSGVAANWCAYIVVPTPVTMRAKPSFSYSSLTIYRGVGGEHNAIKGLEGYSLLPNALNIAAYPSASFSDKTPAAIEGRVIFDAEL